VYYNDFSIVVIFLVGAFLGVGRCPVATGNRYSVNIANFLVVRLSAILAG
jgi:hypothetical protein